jgi:pilus assembly protein Flp/PilA
MRRFIKAFARDDRGVSALEYAILAGIIVLALVASLGTFSTALTGLWTKLTTAVTGA